MDIHQLRNGYLTLNQGLQGFEVTVVVTNPDWEPTREFLADTASDVRGMYPGIAVVNVNWTRENHD